MFPNPLQPIRKVSPVLLFMIGYCLSPFDTFNILQIV
nr:MAG TPA: hypothetical protein [Bacteriophage sp.]